MGRGGQGWGGQREREGEGSARPHLLHAADSDRRDITRICPGRQWEAKGRNVSETGAQQGLSRGRLLQGRGGHSGPCWKRRAQGRRVDPVLAVIIRGPRAGTRGCGPWIGWFYAGTGSGADCGLWIVHCLLSVSVGACQNEAASTGRASGANSGSSLLACGVWRVASGFWACADQTSAAGGRGRGRNGSRGRRQSPTRWERQGGTRLATRNQQCLLGDSSACGFVCLWLVCLSACGFFVEGFAAVNRQARPVLA